MVVEAIDGLRVGMKVLWEEYSYDAQSTAWQTIPGTLVFDANDEHKYQQPEPAVTAAIRVKLLSSEDAPAITTTTLPGGTIGTPYHHQLQANGGGFILWELFSGELPKGLTLKQTTGEISGTPTAAQTAQFTVRALNSVGNDKKELSITIANVPAVEHTVTVTNDGNGTGTAAPSTAAAGTEITLTATPNTGYHFKEWQVISGGVTIKDNKFTMPNAHVEVKAIFEEDVPAPTEFIVTFDGKILGKPATEDEARTMLRELSGRTHQVATGVCIVKAGDTAAPHAAESLSFVDATDVTFYELTDEQIEHYVASGEPMDKAGAYGIQGTGGRMLVHDISGDFYNVVGLPIARVARAIQKLS